MKCQSSQALAMEQAQYKAAYDAACKRVLSEKIFLAWILQQCVEEFTAFSIEYIMTHCIEGTPQIGDIPVHADEPNQIQGMNTESTSLTEGTISYDILFRAIVPDTEEPLELIINLESQRKDNPGYPLVKRGIYYCARLLSSQYSREFTKSHYEQLKKVYSIWICTNPAKKRKQSIISYGIHEDVLIGTSEEYSQNYDLLTLIMLRLGDENDKTNPILRLLSVLLSNTLNVQAKRDILKDEFQIPMTEEIEEEVIGMCNLSDAIEEKGIAKGIVKGEAQGMNKKELQVISRMIKRNMSYEDMADILDVPVERVKELIQKQR